MKYNILKSQKETLIKLIEEVAKGSPYLLHESKISDTEIEITVIASSFTLSQIDELENIDLNKINIFNKGKANSSISLFDD